MGQDSCPDVNFHAVYMSLQRQRKLEYWSRSRAAECCCWLVGASESMDISIVSPGKMNWQLRISCMVERRLPGFI